MMIIWAFLLLQCLSAVCSESIDQRLRAAYKSDTTSNGDVIVEYDMVFERDVYEQRMARMEARDSELETRKATTGKLWTNGVIPYKINTPDFSTAESNIIKSAMRAWEAQTCLKFPAAKASDKNFIFIKNDTGCNSYVGMGGGGSRQVSLDSNGCRGKDTVIHELGHALGFEHEHQRPDRDNHITVTKGNILEKWSWALDKMKTEDVNTHSIPYDYSSIMHYGRTSFGKTGSDGFEMQTITTKDKKWQYRIGTGQLPSFYDFKMANLIYKCASKCQAKNCRDDGFLDKNCVCQCKGWPIHKCDEGKASDGNGYDDSLKCKDKSSDCAEFKGYGYCSGSEYTPYMQGNCMKTCGLC